MLSYGKIKILIFPFGLKNHNVLNDFFCIPKGTK